MEAVGTETTLHESGGHDAGRETAPVPPPSQPQPPPAAAATEPRVPTLRTTSRTVEADSRHDTGTGQRAAAALSAAKFAGFGDGTEWTAEEEAVLFHFQAVMGNAWVEISRYLSVHNDSRVKNRYYSAVRRVQRAYGYPQDQATTLLTAYARVHMGEADWVRALTAVKASERVAAGLNFPALERMRDRALAERASFLKQFAHSFADGSAGSGGGTPRDGETDAAAQHRNAMRRVHAHPLIIKVLSLSEQEREALFFANSRIVQQPMEAGRVADALPQTTTRSGSTASSHELHPYAAAPEANAHLPRLSYSTAVPGGSDLASGVGSVHPMLLRTHIPTLQLSGLNLPAQGMDALPMQGSPWLAVDADGFNSRRSSMTQQSSLSAVAPYMLPGPHMQPGAGYMHYTNDVAHLQRAYDDAAALRGSSMVHPAYLGQAMPPAQAALVAPRAWERAPDDGGLSQSPFTPTPGAPGGTPDVSASCAPPVTARSSTSSRVRLGRDAGSSSPAHPALMPPLITTAVPSNELGGTCTGRSAAHSCMSTGDAETVAASASPTVVTATADDASTVLAQMLTPLSAPYAQDGQDARAPMVSSARIAVRMGTRTVGRAKPALDAAAPDAFKANRDAPGNGPAVNAASLRAPMTEYAHTSGIVSGTKRMPTESALELRTVSARLVEGSHDAAAAPAAATAASAPAPTSAPPPAPMPAAAPAAPVLPHTLPASHPQPPQQRAALQFPSGYPHFSGAQAAAGTAGLVSPPLSAHDAMLGYTTDPRAGGTSLASSPGYASSYAPLPLADTAALSYHTAPSYHGATGGAYAGQGIWGAGSGMPLPAHMTMVMPPGAAALAGAGGGGDAHSAPYFMPVYGGGGTPSLPSMHYLYNMMMMPNTSSLSYPSAAPTHLASSHGMLLPSMPSHGMLPHAHDGSGAYVGRDAAAVGGRYVQQPPPFYSGAGDMAPMPPYH